MPVRSRLARRSANYASATETYFGQVTAGVTWDSSFKISDLVRIPTLAPAYQEYRITGIRVKLLPPFNMFDPKQYGGLQFPQPQLWWRTDRTNELPSGMTPAQFSQLGCVPKTYSSNKPTHIFVRPAVNIADAGPAVVAMSRTSPWIPCYAGGAPNFNVIHNGLHLNITRMNGADAMVYGIEVTYTVQFRKPSVNHA